VNSKLVHKEKPMPLDKHSFEQTSTSGAYRHVQMLAINQDIKEWYFDFVHKTSCVKVLGNRMQPSLISMNIMDVRTIIDFSRRHLTHLDMILVKEEKLQLELFVNFEKSIKPLFVKLTKA